MIRLSMVEVGSGPPWFRVVSHSFALFKKLVYIKDSVCFQKSIHQFLTAHSVQDSHISKLTRSYLVSAYFHRPTCILQVSGTWKESGTSGANLHEEAQGEHAASWSSHSNWKPSVLTNANGLLSWLLLLLFKCYGYYLRAFLWCTLKQRATAHIVET